MKLKSFVPAAIAAAFLAGCGDKPANNPGVGVGASASAGVDTSSSESTSRDRKISTDDSSSVSIQMPVWGLVTETAQAIINDNQEALNAAGPINLQIQLIDLSISITAPALEIAREKRDAKLIAESEEQIHELQEKKRQLEEYASSAGCKDGLGKLSVPNTKYESLINDGACGSMIALANMIITSAEGDVGWPGSIGFNVNKAYEWASPFARLVEVVNLSGAEILKFIPSRALRDPDDAKARIRAAMVDFVKAGKVKAVWDQTNTEGDFNANWSPTQAYPVHFRIGSTYYGRDQAGWHIIKNGIEWFGSGKVLGRDMTVALQSVISTGMSKSTGTGSEQGTSTGVDSKGEAGVR